MSNNHFSPNAISYKELNALLSKAKKEILSVQSSEENKIKVQSLSIEELQNYKRELKEMIKFLENEIIKRQDEKIKAEKFFQR